MMRFETNAASCKVFLLLLCGLTSCGYGESPEGTVEQFYHYLNDGEYTKAKEMYSAAARKVVDGELLV